MLPFTHHPQQAGPTLLESNALFPAVRCTVTVTHWGKLSCDPCSHRKCHSYLNFRSLEQLPGAPHRSLVAKDYVTPAGPFSLISMPWMDTLR